MAIQQADFVESLKFSGYVLVKPFKGFYELKYEKRGTLRAGLAFLLAYYITSVVRALYSGYIFNPSKDSPVNLFLILLQAVMPLVLFCVANWCLTLLLDGEGTMPQIAMGLCYCTIPLTANNLLCTVLSNLLIENESVYITVLNAFAYLYAGFLLLVCIMEINQYTFSRSIAASLLSVLGIAVILFIFLLCFNLFQEMLAFFQSFFYEIYYRL